MLFGNWILSDKGIAWNSEESNFTIPIESLTRIKTSWKGNRHYDWILSATAEEWLSQDDLYDLNFAFVYAAAKAGLDFDYQVFDATLDEQFDQLDLEDDDEF